MTAISAADTKAMLTAVATSVGWRVERKNAMNATLTTKATPSAAVRRYIRLKTQPITVIAM